MVILTKLSFKRGIMSSIGFIKQFESALAEDDSLSYGEVLQRGLNHILKTALLFSLFLGFGGVFTVFYPIITELIICILTILVMVINKAYSLNTKLLIVSLLACFIFFTLCIITKSNLSDYRVIFVRIFTLLFIIMAFSYDFKEICKYFIIAIKVIVILALINSILTTVIPDLFSHRSTDNGYEVNTIGYIFNQMKGVYQLGLLTINRNQGIFWEPGILQIPVNIFIFYKLIEQRESFKSIILPSIVILTTGSTTGYIVFFVILIVRFFQTPSLRRVEVSRLLVFTIIMLIFLPIFFMEVNRKFYGEAKTSSLLRT